MSDSSAVKRSASDDLNPFLDFYPSAIICDFQKSFTILTISYFPIILL